MASFQPARKTSLKSEVHVLGETEVEWELSGRSGPLSHLIRSKACCLVNIPVNNNPASDIKLRFHLKPNQCDDELVESYCAQEIMSSEFLSGSDEPSPGNSLLVDVLSRQENLTFSVSVKKLNVHQQTVANNVVNLDPFSHRENIVVMPNFWITDKSGDIHNRQSTFADTVDNARFHLTITAYDLTNTGTGATDSLKIPSFYSTRARLAEKSAVLLRDVARKSKEILSSVDSNWWRVAVYAMIIVACIAVAWIAIKVDKNQEKLDDCKAFWNQMDPKEVVKKMAEIKKGIMSESSCERRIEQACKKDGVRHIEEIKKLEGTIKMLMEKHFALKREQHNDLLSLGMVALIFFSILGLVNLITNFVGLLIK